MAKISLIIINYNGKDLITSCLKTLESQSIKNLEIIIVDNGSLDDSLNEIQRYLDSRPITSHIKFISLGKNAGFAGGNLEGLRHANGEYIALLNNDTEPDKEWLGELVTAIESDHRIGICASKMILHGTDIVDSAGDGFSAALRGFKRGEGEKSFLYNKREYVFGACAGAALYRRKMIEEIGFFDEDFFLIHEDTDLNFRAQLYGWKVLYVPTAIAYHKVRSSIGKRSPNAIYYTLRNSELVRMKNIPFSLFLICLPWLILGMVSEFLFFAVRHRHPILYFKAKIDVIRMFPLMLKKRKVNLKVTKVESTDLRKLITPAFERNFLRSKLKKFVSE